MIHDTQNAQISHKQDERNIYVIMKTMCPPGYHHNGFVTTHALGHMMYGYHVPKCTSCSQPYIMCTSCAHVPKCISCAQPYIMCPSVPKCPSHCGDNREGTLFS